ncbi:MAG TPA: DEAD/DEAH box helicase family protein [Sedimentisphaerales bacterium]|nr:DEAD/DEAH box helicase family protein [Sedimentisphaerales bacterium]
MKGTELRNPISLSFDRGTLRLKGLEHKDLPIIPGSSAWTWDARVGAWRCDAIAYCPVRAALNARFAPSFLDDVPQPVAVCWPKVELARHADGGLAQLRPEQTEALAAWRQAGRRGQIIMPTGTGKTEVALAAMSEVAIATLVVAPVRDLMYQWHRRILRAFDYDAGIVGDSLYNIKPVTVTTYDSAYIHMDKMGAGFGLLIFDEEHHLPGKCRREAAILSAAGMRMGLSATPERSDGLHKDLDWLIGPVVYRMPFKKAKGSTLADFDVVRIPVALNDIEQATYDQCSRVVRHFIASRRKDMPGYTWQDLCKESGQDPHARHAQRAYYLKQSIEDRAQEKLRVLEDIFRLHNGQQILVFAGSNAMAIEVSKRFLVPTILSHTRKRERLTVLEGFARGQFSVLVANRVLDEGVDVPEAKVAVVIGGQASTRQAKQRLGRVLRRSGNARAALYEVVCENTKEVDRSRKRRRSDAYERTVHRRV